jgi:hypothetical protein
MITDPDIDNRYDLTAMLVRPLYFGMLVNIVVPAGLLFVCYYISNKYSPENRVPEISNALFYIFCALALAQAGLALWWRHKKFDGPMVKRAESIEFDIAAAVYERSRPIFVLIASITGWGFLYFILTGRFTESVIYIIFSFVVFQVVRPRFGWVRSLIVHQEKLVKEGRFAGGGLADIRKEVQG